MIEKYRYRPPFKYLIVGLLALLAATIFGLAIGKAELWFSIIMGLFCLMTLLTGIGFLVVFVRKFNDGNLVVGKDFIEIPGRWMKRTRLNFSDIIDIREFYTYDNVIEIESKEEIHLIEKNWMKKEEFEKIRNKLLKYSKNK